MPLSYFEQMEQFITAVQSMFDDLYSRLDNDLPIERKHLEIWEDAIKLVATDIYK